MSHGAILGAVASGAVATAGIEQSLESTIGELGGLAGLAGVVVFLFRWGNQQRENATTAAMATITAIEIKHADVVERLEAAHERELAVYSQVADEWERRFMEIAVDQRPKSAPE